MKLSLLFLPLLAASLAYAQPSNAILNGSWAFQLQTGAISLADVPPTVTFWDCEAACETGDDPTRTRDLKTSATIQTPGAAAVGTFTAQPGGTLTATLTVSSAGVISRRQTTSGRYILYPDNSGGEIMIMVNGFAVQLEFVWSNNFTQMLFVSDEVNIRYNSNVVITGNARRGPTGCPAGIGDPINLLNGTAWSFRLSQAYIYSTGDASVGIFRPFVSNGAGFLTAVETATLASGTVYRLQPESGRYQVYPGCSGGEIMLMNRAPGAVQLEFVFVGANFDEMFLLNDSAVNPADVALAGQAFRF